MTNPTISSETIANENSKDNAFLETAQDRLINRFKRQVRENEPVVFEFTNDKELMHQYYLLREQMFWRNAKYLDEKGIDDVYDKISEILVARRGNQVIGACRLTFREADEEFLLPMETETFKLRNLFPNLPLDKERHAVISKFAILEEHRAHEILYGLCKILFDRVISYDAYYVFARAENYALGRNWRLIANSFGARHTKICEDIAVSENPNVPGVRRYLTFSDLSDLCQSVRPRVPVPTVRKLELVD